MFTRVIAAGSRRAQATADLGSAGVEAVDDRQVTPASSSKMPSCWVCPGSLSGRGWADGVVELAAGAFAGHRYRSGRHR